MGLDVEKLSFKVKKESCLEFDQKYWLILGLKRADSDLEIKSRYENQSLKRIYANFTIKLSKKKLRNLPFIKNSSLDIDTHIFSVMPLLILLIILIISYINFLRKFHLKIFELK